MLATVLLALVTSTVVIGSGIAAAQESERFARGGPDLDVHAPIHTVTPGQTQAIELVVTNDGEITAGTLQNRNQITTARNVRVTAESDDDSPIEVEGGTHALGSVTEGRPGRTSIRLTVADDAEPGTYQLDIKVEHSYTRLISDLYGVTQEEFESTTETVTVEVDDSARFLVRGASTTAPVGDTGALTLEMENVGTETAHDALVAGTSNSKQFTFDGAQSDETYVGRWEPGKVKSVPFDVAVGEGASIRPYAVEASVAYEDSAGVDAVDKEIVSGVTPLPEQRFRIEGLEADLRVGEDGTLVGDVVNDGPHQVEDVTIRFPEHQNVYPKAAEYAVGSLDVDESATFRFPLDVGSEAEPVPHQFDLQVAYTNHDGDVRRTDDPTVSVDLRKSRDAFTIKPVDASVEAGSENVVAFEITNELDEPIEDAHMKLFADTPFSATDDEAFVPTLEPGETRTIEFGVDVDDGTIPKTHELSVDVRYDDASGETKLSDTYSVPMDVSPSEEGFISSILGVSNAGGVGGVGGLFGAGLAGLWTVRRRDLDTLLQ